MDEVEFSITDEALDFIVDKALEYKLGSWITFLCEAVLTDAMYELPSSDVKIRIDEEYANETLNKNLLKRLELLKNYSFLKTTARSFN
jgi:ATP-dependent Clp protease ATP-binding subunit ClpX